MIRTEKRLGCSKAVVTDFSGPVTSLQKSYGCSTCMVGRGSPQGDKGTHQGLGDLLWIKHALVLEWSTNVNRSRASCLAASYSQEIQIAQQSCVRWSSYKLGRLTGYVWLKTHRSSSSSLICLKTCYFSPGPFFGSVEIIRWLFLKSVEMP